LAVDGDPDRVLELTVDGVLDPGHRADVARLDLGPELRVGHLGALGGPDQQGRQHPVEHQQPQQQHPEPGPEQPRPLPPLASVARAPSTRHGTRPPPSGVAPRSGRSGLPALVLASLPSRWVSAITEPPRPAVQRALPPHPGRNYPEGRPADGRSRSSAGRTGPACLPHSGRAVQFVNIAAGKAVGALDNFMRHISPSTRSLVKFGRCCRCPASRQAGKSPRRQLHHGNPIGHIERAPGPWGDQEQDAGRSIDAATSADQMSECVRREVARSVACGQGSAGWCGVALGPPSAPRRDEPARLIAPTRGQRGLWPRPPRTGEGGRRDRVGAGG
jgi:hypothetical protein